MTVTSYPRFLNSSADFVQERHGRVNSRAFNCERGFRPFGPQRHLSASRIKSRNASSPRTITWFE